MTARKIQRAEYLMALVTKYSHRWGEDPSQRMLNWIDEGNELINELRGTPEWEERCRERGISSGIDMYDCIA